MVQDILYTPNRTHVFVEGNFSDVIRHGERDALYFYYQSQGAFDFDMDSKWHWMTRSFTLLPLEEIKKGDVTGSIKYVLGEIDQDTTRVQIDFLNAEIGIVYLVDKSMESWIESNFNNVEFNHVITSIYRGVFPPYTDDLLLRVFRANNYIVQILTSDGEIKYANVEDENVRSNPNYFQYLIANSLEGHEIRDVNLELIGDFNPLSINLDQLNEDFKSVRVRQSVDDSGKLQLAPEISNIKK